MKSTRENAHMTVEETGTVAFMMSDGEERSNTGSGRKTSPIREANKTKTK